MSSATGGHEKLGTSLDGNVAALALPNGRSPKLVLLDETDARGSRRQCDEMVAWLVPAQRP
jgi:hypothetical protein